MRRLLDGGNRLRLLGQCRLQHRARGLQFQYAVAVGWCAVVGPLAFDVAVVALAVRGGQGIRIGQRLLHRWRHRQAIGRPAVAVVRQFVARSDRPGAVGDVAGDGVLRLRLQLGSALRLGGFLHVAAAIVGAGDLGLDQPMPLTVRCIASPVGVAQAGTVSGIGWLPIRILRSGRIFEGERCSGIGGLVIEFACLLVAGDDRGGGRVVYPVVGGVGFALARPGTAVERPLRAGAIGLGVDGAVVEQRGGLLASGTQEIRIGCDQHHRPGARATQRVGSGSTAGPATDVAAGKVRKLRLRGERVVLAEELRGALAGHHRVGGGGEYAGSPQCLACR